MKITKEHKEQALKIFKGNDSLEEVFVNKQGEFFTSHNNAALSVKNKKTDYARITRTSVIALIDVEIEGDKTDYDHTKDQTVKKDGEGMVLICGDKELTFPKIKNEVREPIEGDEATVNGKAASGTFEYNGSKLTFKDGKLTKKEYEKGGVQAFFKKLIG